LRKSSPLAARRSPLGVFGLSLRIGISSGMRRRNGDAAGVDERMIQLRSKIEALAAIPSRGNRSPCAGCEAPRFGPLSKNRQFR
jgi:hypothetical protein